MPSMQHKQLFLHTLEVITNISAFMTLKRFLTPLSYQFFWNNCLKQVSMACASCGTSLSPGTHTLPVMLGWMAVFQAPPCWPWCLTRICTFPHTFLGCDGLPTQAYHLTYHWGVLYRLVQLHTLMAFAPLRGGGMI